MHETVGKCPNVISTLLCVALGSPVTNQFFMDDLKVYAGSKWGLSTTANVVERVFKAIGMELGLRKCAVAHMVEHDIQVEDHTLPEERVIGSLTQGDVYKCSNHP